VASGWLERTLEGHTDWVWAVAVTPDSARIVSGGNDRTVRIWNLATWALERTLKGHTDRVYAVAVTPDGSRIVSGGGDDTIRIWDASGGGETAAAT
jgi:WD40 repeat protein